MTTENIKILTDEIFAKEGSVFAFSDVAMEALGLELNKEQLRKLFDALPRRVKMIAFEWTTSDTVFRDNAYEFIQTNAWTTSEVGPSE